MTELRSVNSSVSSLSSNPFATRFVSPGKVAWEGADDCLKQLASRWQALNFRAAIVGVHGSGKSTLLEHFAPWIGDVLWRRDAEGRRFSTLHCNNDSSKGGWPTVWLQLRKADPQSMDIPWAELSQGRVLILDGYEQLACWRRTMLVLRTAQRRVKLLVTSHRRTALATLCELSIKAPTARRIVSQLTAGCGDGATFSDAEIQLCLQAHGGNMREVLMDFYDRVEERRAVGTPKVKTKS